MKRKRILAAAFALVLVFTLIAPAFAVDSKTYDTFNSPVRHRFDTAAIHNATGFWSSIKDVNYNIEYYNVDTGQTSATNCKQYFYIITIDGVKISSKRTTYSGGNCVVNTFTGNGNYVKLRIYNPNYVNNGNVPWRLKTSGLYHGS